MYDKLRNLSLDESGVSLACEALVGARVCPVDVRHDQLSGHLTITRLRYLPSNKNIDKGVYYIIYTYLAFDNYFICNPESCILTFKAFYTVVCNAIFS